MSTSPFADASATECSVCTDEFVEPKMLPCGHQFCKDCIIGWLRSGGFIRATCPFCRSPIVTTNWPSSTMGLTMFRGTDNRLDQVTQMVEAMPTNYGMEAIVKAREVLRSPNACVWCEGTVEAVSYCFHCEAKMCRDCLDIHSQTMRSHPVENVDNLTQTTLTGQEIVKCWKHPDRQAQYYCHIHNTMICDLCVESEHGDHSCLGFSSVQETGRLFRSNLQKVVEIMKENASTMASQIKVTKDSFQETERDINEVFDDLEESLEMRRQSLIDALRAKKTHADSALCTQKINQAAMTENASSVQTLVIISSDGILARMFCGIKEQVGGLYRKVAKTQAADGVTFTLSKKMMRKFKADIDCIGNVRKMIVSNTPRRTIEDVRDIQVRALAPGYAIQDLAGWMTTTAQKYP